MANRRDVRSVEELNALAAVDASVDYTALPVDPTTILRDVRFLNDLAEFYRERDGTTFTSADELIDYFYTDRVWRNENEVGIIEDATQAWNGTPEQRGRQARIQTVYDRLPSFWREGGRGVSALADIVPAQLLNPSNLVGGFAVKAAAKALGFGGREVVGSVVRALGRGAAIEGGINAGVSAGADVATQVRDIQLGRQEGYSAGQTAVAAATGGVLGSALSLPLNVAPAVIGARAGVRDRLADEASTAAAEAAARAAADSAQPAAAPNPLGSPQTDLGLQAAGQHPASVPGTQTPPPADPQVVLDGHFDALEGRLKQAMDALVSDGLEIAEQAEFDRLNNRLAQIQYLRNYPARAAAAATPGTPTDTLTINRERALYNALLRDPSEQRIEEQLDLFARPAPEALPAAASAEGAAAPEQAAPAEATPAAEAEAPEPLGADVINGLVGEMDALYRGDRELVAIHLGVVPEYQPHAEEILKAFDDYQASRNTAGMAADTPLDEDGNPIPKSSGTTGSNLGKLEGRATPANRSGIGAPIGGTPQRISRGMLGLEGARAEAANRAGPRGRVADISPFDFVYRGRPGTTADGVAFKRGDTLFYDPRTDKLYADRANVPGGDAQISTAASARTDAYANDVDLMPGMEKQWSSANPAQRFLPEAMEDAKRTGKATEFWVGATDELGNGKPTGDGAHLIKNRRALYNPEDGQFYTSRETLPKRAAPPTKQIPVDIAAQIMKASEAFAAGKIDNETFKAEISRIAGSTPAKAADPAAAAPAAGPVSEAPKAAPAQTEAINSTPTPAPAQASAAADRRLAIRKISDQSQVRVASDNQVAAGATPQMLMGKSDPKDWEVGSVPEGTKSGSKAAVDGFAKTGEEPKAATPATPAPTSKELAAQKTPEGIPGVRMEDFYERKVRFPDGEEVTGKFLLNMIGQAELAPWHRIGTADWDSAITRLVQLYEALAAAATDIILPTASRAQAVESVTTLMGKHSPEDVVTSLDLLRRLNTPEDKAPIIQAGDPGGRRSGFYALPGNPLDTANKITLGSETIAKQANAPASTILIHEIGHWAYMNILTPADRLEFWKIVQRNYMSGPGRPDDAKIMAKVPPLWNGIDIQNPQEFFANQFMMWVQQQRGIPGSESLWRKMARVAENLIRAFYTKESIDPDLEKLFAKILPAEVAKQRVRVADIAPVTPAGKATYQLFTASEQMRIGLEKALNLTTSGLAKTSKNLTNVERIISSHARMLAQLADRGDIPPEVKAKVDAVLDNVNTVTHKGDADFYDVVGAGNSMFDALVSIQHVFADRLRAQEKITGTVPSPIIQTGDRTFRTKKGQWAHKRLIDIEMMRSTMDEALASQSRNVYETFRDVASTLNGMATMRSLFRHWPELKPLKDELYKLVSVEGGETKDGALAIMPEPTDELFVKLADISGRINEVLNKAKATLERIERKWEGVNSDGSPVIPRRPEDGKAPIKSTKAIADRMIQKGMQKKQAYAAAKAVVSKNKAKEAAEVQDPLLAMSDADLTAAAGKTKEGSPRFKAVSIEMERRLRTTPNAAPPGWQPPKDIFQARNLREELVKALQSGDKARAENLGFEIQRRWAKKGQPAVALYPSSGLIHRAMTDERLHNSIPQDEVGIPQMATEAVKGLLRFLTHRDPMTQFVMRTSTYRSLNMLRHSVLEALNEDTHIIDLGTMFRLIGEAPPPGMTIDGYFGDWGAKGVRTHALQKIRRFAIAVSKETGDPVVVMHEAGHLAYWTSLTPEQHRQIEGAYYDALDAGDPTALKVDRAYLAPGSHPAQEWFVESFAEWMQSLQVTTKHGRQELRGTLSRLYVHMREATAYLLNGLIGRKDVKQIFRSLTYYGDMLGAGRAERPINAGMGDNFWFPSGMAAQAASETIKNASKGKIEKMVSFTSGGPSLEKGKLKPYYHGTPNGEWLKSKDAVFEPSAEGEYGPGAYLTDREDIADRIFAQNGATRLSLEAMIEKNVAFFAKEGAREMIKARSGQRSIVTELRLEKIQYQQAKESDDEITKFLAEERLATIDNEIADAVDELHNIEIALSKIGIKQSPAVAPVLVGVKRPFDFRKTARYKIGGQQVARILEQLRKNGMIDDGHIEQFKHEIEIAANDPRALDPADYFKQGKDGTVNGQQLYRALVSTVWGNGLTMESGKAAVTDALKDLGYDAIRSTHRHFFAETPHISESFEGLVVFEPNHIKHINATDFDATSPKLYKRDFDTNRNAGAPTGSLMQAAMDSDGAFQPVASGPYMGAVANWGGAGPALTNTMRRIMRKDEPNAADNETAISFSGPLQLRTNASRLRKFSNANYVADFAEGNVERQQQAIATKILPIFADLRKLPGAKGINRWAQSLKFWGKVAQPAAYGRIVSAMRRGDLSKLDPQERAVADKIQKLFRAELEALRAAGIRIGNVLNYFPQVYDIDRIIANYEQVQNALADYFQREHSLDPTLQPIDRVTALEKGRGVIERLRDDDGAYIPAGAEGRAPHADHIDYQRMINLHKPEHRADLDALEPFLKDDLEGLLAKYFDGSTRRLEFNKKFGLSNHGYYDYQTVAEKGRAGIRHLLSSKKVLTVHRNKVTDIGVEAAGYNLDIYLPFGREQTDALMTALEEAIAMSDGDAARRILMGARDISRLPPASQSAYIHRMDAIASAIGDFGQKIHIGGRGMKSQEMKFMDGFFLSMQRKPFITGPHVDNLALASKWLRNINAVTLLGFTTLTSIPDAALPLIRSGSFRTWTKAMAKVTTDPDYRIALRNVGTSIDNIVHGAMAGLYGAEGGGRATTAFFNVIGLTPWTDAWRNVSAAVAFEAFKTHQKQMIKYASKPNRQYRIAKRFMDHFGLTHYGMPTAPNMESMDVLQRPDVRAAILKFTNETLFAPSKNDIPLWAQTPWGSIMFQLKSFPLMMGRLSKQVLRDAKAGNPFPLMYMMSIGTGVAAAGLAAKDYIQARGGEDNNERKLRERSLAKIAEQFGFDTGTDGWGDTFLGWYIEAFMAQGGLGMIAELFYNLTSEVDNGAWGQQRAAGYLFGPSYSLGTDAFNVLAGAQDALLGNDSNAKERSAVRTVAGRLPILGGLRDVREGAVDTVAGAPQERGGSSGSSTASGFDGGGFEDGGFDGGGFEGGGFE